MWAKYRSKQETFHEKISNISYSFDDSLIGHYACAANDFPKSKSASLPNWPAMFRPWAHSCKNAAEMAVQEVNDAGRHSRWATRNINQTIMRGQRRKGWPIGILRAKADYAAKGYSDSRPNVSRYTLPALKLLNQLKLSWSPLVTARKPRWTPNGGSKKYVFRLLHWSVSGRCACQFALDTSSWRRRRFFTMLLRIQQASPKYLRTSTRKRRQGGAFEPTHQR